MGINLLDQYSLLHLAVGIVVYFWGINFWLWTLIHLAFESLENTPIGMRVINKYITFWPGGKTHPDNILNQCGDVLSGSIGWLLAKWIDRTFYVTHAT
jgi:hypothetical protein